MINFSTTGQKVVATLVVVVASIILALASLGFSLISPVWLLLLLVPIIGVPILRELGLLKDVDERELLNSYRSSHLAFYSVVVTIIILSLDKIVLGKPVSERDLYSLLFVAFVVKVAGVLVMNLPPKLAGLVIAFAAGGWWTLFVLVAHGFSFVTLTEIPVGLSVLVAAVISIFFPRIGGVLLCVIGLLFAYQVINVCVHYPLVETFIFNLATFVMPPLLAGILIFTSRWLETKEEKGMSEPDSNLSS